MSKLSLFIYIVSVLVTIGIFYLINFLTETVTVGESNNMGNGNPGLFPLIYLTPFLIISIIGTFKLIYVFVERRIRTIQPLLIMLFSLIGSIIIYFLTYREARQMRTLFFNNNDSVTRINEIPLLNSYSNNIFFNGWTLLALLFTVTFIACLIALIRQKDKSF